MRVGFLITLSDQIERFEPLVRRTPGARFLVGPGRWPSAHRDSRAEIIRRLDAGGLAPVISPGADFDLIVAGSECPENSVRAWIRPRGTRVLWREPDTPEPTLAPSLTLCAGQALLPRDRSQLAHAVGDPLLDAVAQSGARARARHRLGLDPESGRPVILLHGEAGDGALEAMATALGSLRIDHDLLVSVSELRRLERARAIPAPLQGPAIHRLPPEFPRAEALALSDLVLTEPGTLLLQAAVLGRPSLALGSRSATPRAREIPLPMEEFTRSVMWVADRDELSGLVDWALRDSQDYREELLALAQRILGVVDGQSTARAVSALQILAAGSDRSPRSAPV